MLTYLQHGKAGEPRRTEQVENKVDRLYHHIHGLMYTATGCGSKLPTEFKVKYLNRWYRVYSVCWSNCSTEYILVNQKKVTVTTNMEAS